MAHIVLGLQGGVASGSEPSFDGQPTQPGTHLRWSFLAALGFPPGGFWLCRRAARPGEQRIPPPPTEGCNQVPGTTPGNSPSPTHGDPASPSGLIPAGTSLPVTGTTDGNQWRATMPHPCESVTLAGCAAPGCDEVIIETFSCDATGALQVSGRRAVKVEQGCFRIRVEACKISCVSVVGAGSVDECGCGPVEPPSDCGCGDHGGGGGDGGGNPPCYGDPGWGPPSDNGWQCWGVPFTLPVTVGNWPARYFGAPDPATTPASVVAQKDIEEAIRRLGTLRLAADLTPAQQRVHLQSLRDELVRLVQGFPFTLLADVPLHTPSAGANAPKLNLDLMEQLLLLALDPYFARVLGLYFVDDTTVPSVHYDYAVTGFWGSTPCQSEVLFPGLAPAAPLARGKQTVFNGMTIQPLGGNTSLWRWTKFDGNGNFDPRLDSSALLGVIPAVSGSLAGLTQSQQPDAMLAAATQGMSFPFVSPPPELSIALSRPVPRVDVQVSGAGTVRGLSGGAVVSGAGFGSAQLTTVTVSATDPNLLIDEIRVAGFSAIAPLGVVVVVGAVTAHPLSPDAIGTHFALIGPPLAIPVVAAPGQPLSTFRHRQADIDTNTLTLVPHSLIDVEWPAPPVTPAQRTGDPVTDPLAMPPPTQPIGFVAERKDSGVAASTQHIPGWIATRSALKPKASLIPTNKLYRLADSQLTDPVGGWSHRVAGFDIFGVLGDWSGWTIPKQVEKIAAAATAMRIMQFDNSASGGGAPAADGSAWIGGTLNLIVNWSGAAFMMYPDIATARIVVEAINSSGSVTGQLTSSDLTIPRAAVLQLTVSSIVATPSADGKSFIVDIQTLPPLAAMGSFDPGQILQVTLADGTTERFTVRPANPLSPAPGPIVARINAGHASRLVTTTGDFLNQPAYLIKGYGTQVVLPVPLTVPVAERTARAQVSVTGSTKKPFLSGEKIIDPNGINLPRLEPQSVKLIFTGAQRLIPATPPTPVHEVNHVFYDPADATGRAAKTLPFTTPVVSGVSGYLLQRSPVRSTAIADIKRRIALGNHADNSPVVLDGGVARADLAIWISSLTQWLSDYNLQNGTAWTSANVLDDSSAQRDFIEHFYGGLLDDELRALADLAANGIGYARVDPHPVAPGAAIADQVDGTGYGRTLYRLAAVNQAGSVSSTTNSIGPYYTQIVTPPRAPVLYKLQATETAIIVAWALDTNPDVAAYLVYRAATLDAVADLRYFGADWAHPAPVSALPTIHYNEKSWPPLTFIQAAPPNIDQRVVGFVADPRLCARDYKGSDMGEIILPTGPPPDQVLGIFRLTEYNSGLPPTAQQAFNYWTPPATGGIAQVVEDSLTQSRLTGLRIGLGRGVPVVVVAKWAAGVRVLGQVPVRRAGFIDGVGAGGAPLDANAIAAAPPPSLTGSNAYVVVAVDIFGNRSLPSKPFAAQFLAKAFGS